MSPAVSATSVSAESSFRQFYDSINDTNVQNGFRCIDQSDNLDYLLAHIQSNSTGNFVLDFCDDTAWAAVDLPAMSITQLMDAEGPSRLHARLINIWYPSRNRLLLEQLATRYDFSPRLLALMSSDPRDTRKPTSTSPPATKSSHTPFWKHTTRQHDIDLELEKGADELSEMCSIASRDSPRNNLYHVLDNLWHYTSVDFGRQYVCIGYNTLYGTKNTGLHPEGGFLPDCLRVWTWLVLCEDSTVLCIHEDPFPFVQSAHLDTIQQRVLIETRRNLTNIVRSLSSIDEAAYTSRNPLTLLPIRRRLGETPEETVHRDTDAPGLLLYYLFENFHNSYALVTRKESRYGVELSHLRTEMIQLPRLQHIDRLDSIGRELSVLKRHYQAYNRIITRLLEPQAITVASLDNSHVVSSTSQVSLDTVRPVVTAKASMLGVPLSSPAKARFRRLKDLIDLYALSEVDEYLKQKDALVAMNFNLIAIKESFDVERLTRITLLLTKATFLFLPVSLMTGYFSVQLVQTEYTVPQYWIAFGVTLFVSWAAMFVFGVFSGDVSTAVFFRQVWNGMVRFWKWLVLKAKR